MSTHTPGSTIVQPQTKIRTTTQRPRLHKVILVNDDYTPREFVVRVLKAEFRMSEEEAYRVMITAHRRGACVVAVYTKDIAETKATRATEQQVIPAVADQQVVIATRVQNVRGAGPHKGSRGVAANQQLAASCAID